MKIVYWYYFLLSNNWWAAIICLQSFCRLQDNHLPFIFLSVFWLIWYNWVTKISKEYPKESCQMANWNWTRVVELLVEWFCYLCITSKQLQLIRRMSLNCWTRKLKIDLCQFQLAFCQTFNLLWLPQPNDWTSVDDQVVNNP